MQQNHGQAGSPNRMFPSYSDTQPGQDPGMGTPGMFHNPSIEKQMAAMNAANIAKMANRSAPGSAQSPVLPQSSSGYFGGNSLMHQSNGNLTTLNLAIPSPSDQHLHSSSMSDFSAHSAQQQGGGPPGIHNFQQNMNMQQSNSMSIATPTSAGPQGAFPDPNHRRSTPVPNQQLAQMQLMQKRKQFIHTIGTLMIQRGQPLPQALTGVAVPPNFDINASPWKNLEPSQTEVGAIRLAGKDIDLYKFFGIVFQTGGGLKVHQMGAWNNVVSLFDLPEHLPPPYSTPTAHFLGHLYMSVLVPFEEWYRKNSMVNRGANPHAQRYPPSAPTNTAGASPQQPSQQQTSQQIQNIPQRHPSQPQLQQPRTPAPGMSDMQGSQYNHMVMSQQGMNTNAGNIGMGGMPGMGNIPISAATDPNNINGMNTAFAPQPVTQPHGSMQGVPGLSDDPSRLALGMMQHIQPQQQNQGQPGTPQQPGLTPNHHQGMDPNFFAAQQQMHPPQIGHLPQSGTTPANGPPPAGLGDFGGLDMDMENRKRKVEEEDEVKRARQKTGELPDVPPSISANGVATSSAPSQPSTIARTRRKITYVPLRHEVDTAGGRNLHQVGPELQRALNHRPLKAIHEWGQVDIDALVMSIRSRLATELSYAITTCSLISVVRDAAKDVPYLMIRQCPDLFDELLDLLEETAFQGAEDIDDEFDDCAKASGPPDLLTVRELLEIVQEEESRPFACLKNDRLGAVIHSSGPKQRPGGVVISVLNIFRNWGAAATDNLEFMTQHPTFCSTMLRLCGLASRKNGNTKIRPASPVLSLSDLITVRKDVALIMIGVTMTQHFSLKELYDRSPTVGKRFTRRMVGLVSSALMEPLEVCSPSSIWSAAAPPATADNALQLWTRFSHPDEARKLIAALIPQAWLGELFRSFVYRLPVSPRDYEVIMKDSWLTYVEKIIMAIYSLAFLAPLELKKKLKVDKSIGFSGIMLRFLRRFMMHPTQNVREFFHVCSKRGIEAMKLLDDEGEVVVDTAPTTSMPALLFGMGWHETGEKKEETGFGILSGFAEDITVSLMLLREVDNTMFSELESMIRVEF